LDGSKVQEYVYFNVNNTDYISIVKPVSDKNSFGLGWLIITRAFKSQSAKAGYKYDTYVIVLLSALIFAIFSSLAAKKYQPVSSLNQHIRAIAERNFGVKIEMPVDAELQELVNSINICPKNWSPMIKPRRPFPKCLP